MLVAGKCFYDLGLMIPEVECLTRIDLNGMVASIDLLIS
jgi:hypothetical protein